MVHMAKSLPAKRILLYWTFLVPALSLFLLGLLPVATGQTQNAQSAPLVRLIEVSGPIGPAKSDYFQRSLERAASDGASLIVIRLDTPGGLDQSMRDMVSAILASPSPVATWVAPSGARAASAGTYIAYASHFAAMAPATNIGSSTPVSMGGGSPTPDMQDDTDNGEEANDSAPGSRSDMERKVINDAVAYIRGLAELRGRNADWAEQSVRQAANLSASEALENNVIDALARSLDELLAALDGRAYNIDGQDGTLSLDNARVETVAPDWRYDFLSILTNPNVAYILLMIGVYGLILEFYNPGMGLPGITGVICLLLGAFALNMLPISYAGLALMVVGLILMAFEVFSPSFGVFGIGGLAAFVLGSIMLMDTDLPAYQISMPLIAGLAAGTFGFFMLVVGALVKSRRQRLAIGNEAMIGESVRAMEDFDQHGHVFAQGETWQAVSDRPVRKGDRLRIRRIDGLTLEVSPDKREQE